jgi:hypothetical protein
MPSAIFFAFVAPVLVFLYVAGVLLGKFTGDRRLNTSDTIVVVGTGVALLAALWSEVLTRFMKVKLGGVEFEVLQRLDEKQQKQERNVDVDASAPRWSVVQERPFWKARAGSIPSGHRNYRNLVLEPHARFARIPEVRVSVLANDDYLAGKIQDFKERKKHDRQLTREELMQKQLDSSFRLMEQIRARVGRDRQGPEDSRSAEAPLPVCL